MIKKMCVNIVEISIIEDNAQHLVKYVLFAIKKIISLRYADQTKGWESQKVIKITKQRKLKKYTR